MTPRMQMTAPPAILDCCDPFRALWRFIAEKRTLGGIIILEPQYLVILAENGPLKDDNSCESP